MKETDDNSAVFCDDPANKMAFFDPTGEDYVGEIIWIPEFPMPSAEVAVKLAKASTTP